MLIFDPTDRDDLERRRIEPIDSPPIATLAPRRRRGGRRARCDDRADLLRARKDIDNAQTDVKFADNQQLPDVRFNASYSGQRPRRHAGAARPAASRAPSSGRATITPFGYGAQPAVRAATIRRGRSASASRIRSARAPKKRTTRAREARTRSRPSERLKSSRSRARFSRCATPAGRSR